MKVAAHALLLATFAMAQLARAAEEIPTIDAPNGELLSVASGTFIGTSRSGGTDSYGTIFRVSGGAEITVLASFTNDVGLAPGQGPRSGLAKGAGEILWGTTEQGGTASLGTVFKFTPSNRKLTTVVNFDGAAKGSSPVAALVRDAAGDLLGTTRLGGAGDFGTVFKVNHTSGALMTLVQFTGTGGLFKGREPRGALYVDANGVIWGTTSGGGAGDLGTIFRLDGSTFATVAEFTGNAGLKPGTSPEAALFASGGLLWGTTALGGSSGKGTIFSLNPSTFAFVSVASFAGTNGANPRAPFIAGSGGVLLGTTENGGANDLGTIFSLNPTSSAISVVSSFSGSNGGAPGAHPHGGLTADGAASFVGTATQGGREDTGLVFGLNNGGTFGPVIDSNPAPGPKPATIKPPTVKTGTPNSTIDLGGTIPDDGGNTQVLVSLNGGPFVVATVTPGAPGKPSAWSIRITPENGTNVIVVKTVNEDGGLSEAKTLTFEFTSVRPEIIGAYAGLAIPAQAGPPLPFSGILSLNVLPTGRFTGKLVLGGLPAAVALKGTFANGGVARFGKTGSPLLIILRKNQSPLTLELALDSTLPFTGNLAGTISENSVAAATIDAAQGVYTAKKNPPAPFAPVPVSLLNPLGEKGAYTGVFRALPPTPNLPADKFPQGHGTATLKIAPTGLVKLVAKLADGVAVTAGGPLIGADRLPFFVSAYKKLGAFTGEILFRDIPGQTDADGSAVLWIRPPSATAANYRAGWSDGLTVDFEGSKFLPPKLGVTTPLGNAPATTVNAQLTLAAGGIPSPPSTAYSLAIGEGGKTVVLGVVPGASSVPLLSVAFSKTGVVSGTFTHPVTNLPTKLIGTVLQKQQAAAGYFLSGSTKTGAQQSGSVEISKQP